MHPQVGPGASAAVEFKVVRAFAKSRPEGEGRSETLQGRSETLQALRKEDARVCWSIIILRNCVRGAARRCKQGERRTAREAAEKPPGLAYLAARRAEQRK
eukprot:5795806-Amphidinium_carterae.1